jgi:hypothetical protein
LTDADLIAEQWLAIAQCAPMSALCQNRTRAVQQKSAYSITSSARAMSFTNGCIFDLHQCRGSQT